MQSRWLWCEQETGVWGAKSKPDTTDAGRRKTDITDEQTRYDLSSLVPSPPLTAMRVLILATTTGYQTRAFGEAAERLGVELVFATDRCHLIDDPWQDGAVPIRFHDEAA